MFPNQATFNEFVIGLSKPAETVLQVLKTKGIDGGIPLSRWYSHWDHALLVSVTEMNEKEDIDDFANALKGALKP